MEQDKISNLSKDELIIWDEWKRLMKEKDGTDWTSDELPFGFWCFLTGKYRKQNNK